MASPCWQVLPPELQEMIFTELILLIRNSPRRRGLLSEYASVSLSWQHRFEQVTFERLQVSQSCLQDLCKAVSGKNKRRIGLIKILWLRIRLPTYDCTACRTPEDEITVQRNCAIFTEAILSLWETMSTWGTPGRHRRGLELEISIHSPSDAEHCYRPPSLKDDCPFTNWFSKPEEEVNQAIQTALDTDASTDDKFHGFLSGYRRSGLAYLGATGRLLGTSRLTLGLSEPLPEVGIVWGLTVRRGSFRGFTADALFKMLDSLMGIVQLRFERWQEVYSDQRLEFDHEFTHLLRQKGFPKSLRNLYLMEEQNSTVHEGLDFPAVFKSELGFYLSRSTRHLENLAITLNTDGEAFLQEFYKRHWGAISPASPAKEPWNNLQTLSLTCRMLFGPDTDDSGQASHRSLLNAACMAAKLMPQLRRMEIWNSELGHAALFSVYIPRGREEKGKIIWMSTWTAGLSPLDKIWGRWRDLVRERDVKRRDPQLQVLTIPLGGGSRWDLTDRLMLKEHGLHPTTARYIAWALRHKGNPNFI